MYEVKYAEEVTKCFDNLQRTLHKSELRLKLIQLINLQLCQITVWYIGLLTMKIFQTLGTEPSTRTLNREYGVVVVY